jgi:hypothetical protein
MAIYLCRWPNGEFSIVKAATRSNAIEKLDEWGNAEQAIISRMTNCMFDFRLRDDGQIELANVGEATDGEIMETCYPVLGQALATAEWDETGSDHLEKGRNEIRDAVASERTRLWDSQPPGKDAETELGRQIQKQTGAASVIVNRAVRQAAKNRLQSREGEGRKPN